MMKKIFKSRRLFIATAGIAFAIFLCLVWIFQAGILKFFALRMLAPFSDKTSMEDLSGNLFSGFFIKNFYVGRKDFQITIPFAKIRSDWRFLLKDRKFLETTAEKPLIKIMSSEKTAGFINTSLLLNLPIKNANISGADIEYHDRDGYIYRLKNTDIQVSIRNRDAIIKSLNTEYTGGRIALSMKGTCDRTGCILTGKMSRTGKEHAGVAVFSTDISSSGIKISGNARIYGGISDFLCKLLPGDKWNAELKFTGLKTGKILKKLESLGTLTGRLTIEGTGFSEETAKGKGIFLGETSGGLKIKSGMEISKGVIFCDADVSRKQTLLKIKSSYALRENFLTAKISSKGKLTPDDKIFGGLTIFSLNWTADVSGKPDAMDVKLIAEAAGIEMDDIKVENASVSGRFQPKKMIELEINAEGLGKDPVKAEKFMFIINGETESHSVKAQIWRDGKHYELNGTGIFAENRWTAEFTELAERTYGGINLQQPWTLEVSPDVVNISGFALSREDEFYEGNLKYHKGEIKEFRFNAKNIDISPFNRFILPELEMQGRIDAGIEFYETGGRKNGQMAFSSKGLYVQGVLIGKMNAVLDFSPQSLVSRDIMIETPGGNLKAGIEMNFDKPWKEIKDYDITIMSSNTDISFLQSFTPYLGLKPVLLNSNIKIISDKSGFSMKGGANISCPNITFPSIGLSFDNVNINLESIQDAIRISGTGGNRNTRLDIEGELNATGPKIKFRTSDTAFEISRWLIGNTEEADILLSGTWRSPELTGAVKLSRLEFFQEKYDETFKTEKISDPGNYAMNITALAERNAWYRAETGSIEARGQIILKKNPNESIRLLGDVESIRGYYSYLGRNFDVKSAKISFTGQIPEDPKIYLLASYDDKPNSVIINFEADGSAKYLKSRLTSEPPMEQRDIISLLVTGQPLYKLYEKETADAQDKTSANLAAQQLLTGYLSAKAGGKVMKALDLDVLSMKLTPERKPDITVGRYLTPDLFISYGQTLGPKGEKRINAEYSISKHFSLEGKNSSEGKYTADFLFKFGIR